MKGSFLLGKGSSQSLEALGRQDELEEPSKKICVCHHPFSGLQLEIFFGMAFAHMCITMFFTASGLEKSSERFATQFCRVCHGVRIPDRCSKGLVFAALQISQTYSWPLFAYSKNKKNARKNLSSYFV